MTKSMSEEVLSQYQEWLSECPIQIHAHGFGSEPTLDNDGKKIKATDCFMADDDDTHRICEVDVYIPLVDQEEN